MIEGSKHHSHSFQHCFPPNCHMHSHVINVCVKPENLLHPILLQNRREQRRPKSQGKKIIVRPWAARQHTIFKISLRRTTTESPPPDSHKTRIFSYALGRPTNNEAAASSRLSVFKIKTLQLDQHVPRHDLSTSNCSTPNPWTLTNPTSCWCWQQVNRFESSRFALALVGLSHTPDTATLRRMRTIISHTLVNVMCAAAGARVTAAHGLNTCCGALDRNVLHKAIDQTLQTWLQSRSRTVRALQLDVLRCALVIVSLSACV